MGGIITFDMQYYIPNEVSDSGNNHKCISKWWGVRLIGNWIFRESKIIPHRLFSGYNKGKKTTF